MGLQEKSQKVAQKEKEKCKGPGVRADFSLHYSSVLRQLKHHWNMRLLEQSVINRTAQ